LMAGRWKVRRSALSLLAS